MMDITGRSRITNRAAIGVLLGGRRGCNHSTLLDIGGSFVIVAVTTIVLYLLSAVKKVRNMEVLQMSKVC